jgi:hypothetical protein
VPSPGASIRHEKAFAAETIANLLVGGDGSNQYKRANISNEILAVGVSLDDAAKALGVSLAAVPRVLQYKPLTGWIARYRQRQGEAGLGGVAPTFRPPGSWLADGEKFGIGLH